MLTTESGLVARRGNRPEVQLTNSAGFCHVGVGRDDAWMIAACRDSTLAVWNPFDGSELIRVENSYGRIVAMDVHASLYVAFATDTHVVVLALTEERPLWLVWLKSADLVRFGPSTLNGEVSLYVTALDTVQVARLTPNALPAQINFFDVKPLFMEIHRSVRCFDAAGFEDNTYTSVLAIVRSDGELVVLYATDESANVYHIAGSYKRAVVCAKNTAFAVVSVDTTGWAALHTSETNFRPRPLVRVGEEAKLFGGQTDVVVGLVDGAYTYSLAAENSTVFAETTESEKCTTSSAPSAST